MPTQEDVRRICRQLPNVSEDEESFTFRVNGRLVAWLWPERIDPKKRRVLNPDVLVVRVRDEFDKQALIDMFPEVIFTEPHYEGYAAVLVRLSRIEMDLLERLIATSWSLQAEKRTRRGTNCH